jgi:hypothetical protein
MPKHNHVLPLSQENVEAYVPNIGVVGSGLTWRKRSSEITGGDQPISLMQPYIGVKFIVRYK